MAYTRKRYSKPRRTSVRKVGRRTARTKRLVDGHGVLSRAERMIRSGASTAQTVSAIARNVGTIMSMINTEKKYFDVSSISGVINNTGTYVRLTPIVQGDGDSNRNGNQILGADFSARITMNYNTSNTAPGSIRLMFIVDKEDPDNTIPTLTQILEDPTNINSAINRDYSKRFTMLKSAVYTLNTQAQQITDKIYMKIPIHLFYKGATGALSDAAENQIWMIAFGDNGAGATTDVAFNYYTRLNYYDN